MKKVLSFVLVLTLVLGSFSMAFAADSETVTLSDIAGNANEEAIQVVADLGIVNGYPDGTFKPATNVTRAEYAKMMVAALNIPDSAIAGFTTTSFTDTEGYAWAVPYLAFCESKGIMNGYGDGTVRPGNNINVNEAIAMALRVVGYTDDALTGSWPANYVTVARDKSLYTDVAASTLVDRASAAQIIYNLLTVGKVSVDKDGALSNVTTWDDDVDAYVAVTLLDNLDCTTGSEVVITGDESAVINLSKYVGAKVVPYMNDDDEIIAIKEVKTTFITGEWSTKDSKFGDYKFTSDADTYASEAFTNGKVDNAKLDKAGETISGAYKYNDGEEYTIAAVLKNGKIDEIVSIMKWEADATFLADDDVQTEIYEDLSINGYVFTEDEDEDDTIDMTSFSLYGVDSLKDIAEDNVITVYCADNEITRLEVGTAKVEGKVSKVNKDGDKFTINGTAYELENISETPAVGETGVALLSYAGKIADWSTEDSTNKIYGVVTNTYVDNGKDGKVAQVKLMNMEGKETWYDLTDACVEDDLDLDMNAENGDKVVNEESLAEALSVDTLYAYKLNKDGEVKSLDATMDDDHKNGIDNRDTASKDAYINAAGTFVNVKYLVEENVYDSQSYKLSTDIAVLVKDGDDYEVSAVKDLKKGTKAEDKITVLAVAVENEKAVVLIVDDTDGAYAEDEGIFGYVTDWAVVPNDDDEDILEVTAIVDGKDVTYTTDTDVDAISEVLDTDSDLTAANLTKTFVEFKLKGDVLDSITAVDTTDVALGVTVKSVDTEGPVIKTETSSIDVDDESVVYVVTLDDDDDFDVMAASSLSKISRNDVVYVYSYRPDSSSTDTTNLVVVVKKADVDYNPFVSH